MGAYNKAFKCWVQVESNMRQLRGSAYVTLDSLVKLNLASLWCATWEKNHADVILWNCYQSIYMVFIIYFTISINYKIKIIKLDRRNNEGRENK